MVAICASIPLPSGRALAADCGADREAKSPTAELRRERSCSDFSPMRLLAGMDFSARRANPARVQRASGQFRISSGEDLIPNGV